MEMVGSELSGLSGRHPGCSCQNRRRYGGMANFGRAYRLRGVFRKEPDPAAPDVYSALQGQMGGALHALALETSVPKNGLPLHRGLEFMEILEW